MNGEPQRPAKTGSRAGLWLRILGTAATLALLYWLVRQQGWEEIAAAMRRIAGWRLAAALGVMLLSRTATALRWHSLLRAVDRRIGTGEALRITFAGLFAANFLPTTIGGDVVRLAACLQLKLDSALSAASLVADRLTGMAGMALFVPWGLVRWFEAGPPPAGLLGAAAFWAGAKEKALAFLRRLLEIFHIWLRQPRALLTALFFTLVHQACLYISIQLMLEGLGEPMGWLRIAGIWSLVYFITLLPVSINGYGVQEVSTVLLYAHLGGISPEAAAVLALLQRVVQMAASLPGALFAPGIIAAARSRRPET